VTIGSDSGTGNLLAISAGVYCFPQYYGAIYAFWEIFSALEQAEIETNKLDKFPVAFGDNVFVEIAQDEKGTAQVVWSNNTQGAQTVLTVSFSDTDLNVGGWIVERVETEEFPNYGKLFFDDAYCFDSEGNVLGAGTASPGTMFGGPLGGALSTGTIRGEAIVECAGSAGRPLDKGQGPAISENILTEATTAFVVGVVPAGDSITVIGEGGA
jgi:hypothetical protein